MLTVVVSEVDSAFFEPTLSDVQSHHASVVARSKRLNEAPLLTAKHRDAERIEKEKRKAEKWPEVS
jgi:tether containing UBX domain for GLUT4